MIMRFINSANSDRFVNGEEIKKKKEKKRKRKRKKKKRERKKEKGMETLSAGRKGETRLIGDKPMSTRGCFCEINLHCLRLQDFRRLCAVDFD